MELSEITAQEMYEQICHAALPELQSFETRNKSKLFFRHYPAESNLVVILLHGIAEDGKYLFRLAEYLSNNQIAQVYTPDVRGYGESPIRRGDVDYIGQLDDDLADLMNLIKRNHPDMRLVLGGHSIGGASVLRFSGGRYNHLVDAYLFLAPYIPNAPYLRNDNENAQTSVSIPKLILLSILEIVRLRSFHHWKILSVDKPVQVRHGSETLNISFRLIMSRIPKNYQKDIAAITEPSFVLVGEKDELFHSDKIESVFKSNPVITTKIVPNHNHDGILYSLETYKAIGEWLMKL